METNELFETVRSRRFESGADFNTSHLKNGPTLYTEKGDIVVTTGVSVPYIDAEDPNTTKVWYQVYHPRHGLGWIVNKELKKVNG